MKLPFKSLLLASAATFFTGTVGATPPGHSGPPVDYESHFSHGEAKPNDFWWPDRVDLTRLRQNAASADPSGAEFDYAEAFSELDLDAVKADINTLLTSSQDWWPADFGNYGGLFIRLAWHSAGTYRAGDGRGGSNGGQQRFEPLNSWPDNGNLDKARRLLQPIKQKYGRSISWSDLMVLAGNVSLENMGFKTLGFAGGRVDAWEPELVYWGPETKFLADDARYSEDGELEEPLAAAELGLIYVNPEGPGGNPDPLAAAGGIRTTFGRMGMNDEETVALIAGGHTLGKMHGAARAASCVGREPAAAGIEEQGLGWKNSCGTGRAADAITSGLEGAWTSTPTQWSQQFISNLINIEWRLTESPGGAKQWEPVNADELKIVPDASDPEKRHAPAMLTTDLTLVKDPAYRQVTQRFYDEPGAFDEAFANAWFKLLHRDLGPRTRYLGPDVPAEAHIWQDPIPSVDHALINKRDIAALKESILGSGLTGPELVRTAWASAVTFRDTDFRGGGNGGRLRLAPQKDWEANSPEELARVVGVLEGIQTEFNSEQRGRSNATRQVSLADLIILGGAAGIEDAARKAGHDIKVPFTPGRADASQDQTDIASFQNLQPAADGFRNYMSARARLAPAEMLVDRADMLTLTVPEMTVLVGGMRALDANAGAAKHGVFTDRPGTLSNDFFVNLVDMSTAWSPADDDGIFEGKDRATGDTKWTATEVDLVFGSNAELRAVAEYYAYDGTEAQFVSDFVDAWTKVMTLDRYDLQ